MEKKELLKPQKSNVVAIQKHGRPKHNICADAACTMI